MFVWAPLVGFAHAFPDAFDVVADQGCNFFHGGFDPVKTAKRVLDFLVVSEDAIPLMRDVLFALDAAVDDAGEGIEEPDAVQGILGQSTTQGIRGEIDEGFGDDGCGETTMGLIGGRGPAH